METSRIVILVLCLVFSLGLVAVIVLLALGVFDTKPKDELLVIPSPGQIDCGPIPTNPSIFVAVTVSPCV